MAVVTAPRILLVVSALLLASCSAREAPKTTRTGANATTENKLGIKTTNSLADFNNIQPRLQLTWDVQGRQKDLIKFGGGIFSAQPVSYLQLNNIQNSGTIVGSIDVSGAAVPKADFVSYLFLFRVWVQQKKESNIYDYLRINFS